FILPFFLFSATAGQLGERMDKARLIRWVKLFEIAAMLLAALGFWLHSIRLLFVVLFLMGVHSSVFGPIKYSILPRVLDPHEELVGGNGLVETATSLAILLGMVVGGVTMASGAHGVWLASTLLITVALFGYAAARRIPALPAPHPQARLHWNIARETWRVLALLREDRGILNAALGISWFWFYAGIFTAQLPNYTTGYLGGTVSVTILALTLFSIGVGIGSLGCERLSGHKVEVGLVPLGAIGFTLAGLDLYFARPGAPLHGGLDWWAWLGAPGNLHVALDLLLVGLFAGLYIVPLYAQIQVRAPFGRLSRIIAGNNVLNALFIVAAAGFAVLALRLGLGIPELFLAVALMNVAVSAYIFLLAPEYLMRAITWVLVRTLYRLRTQGLQRMPVEGPLLLVCNHVSYMDPLIILGSVRRPLRFVMDNRIFVTPVLRYVFRVGRA
ncbi:phospholipid/glycerol acyltransferase, partial [mine drainage metagenome]